MIHSKKQVAETWDQIAGKYGSYNRKSWKAFEDFLRGTKGLILDVGCGNAPVRGKVIGLDISFQSCKLAKKKINVVCGDATFLPFKSKTFPKVISKAMIHHLPTKEDRLNFLREIKRVLNGTALISGWYRWQWKHMPLALFTKDLSIKWHNLDRYYHLFSERELFNLAKQVFSEFRIVVQSDARYKNLYLYINK